MEDRNERTLEVIRVSLSRIEDFFSTEKSKGTDSRTLSLIEHDLVKIESMLRTYAGYKPRSV